jgi:hypothetical protein
VDVDKLKAMVNVKDEDIQALDKFVTREGSRTMKIRKELWFGFSLMALIVLAALYMLLSVPRIDPATSAC